MTLTTYPVSAADSPDLTALSLSRLVHRLELNLLVPSADLSPLRQSEYQRMRVGAVRLFSLLLLPLRVSRSPGAYTDEEPRARQTAPRAIRPRIHLTEHRT